MADLESTGRPPLHPGVDPQSWLGFEQRIQARRFNALVASARQAIASGDAGLAEHAIEEAREIRADAAELIPLDIGLRRLRPLEQGPGPSLVRRTARACVLLAAGVSMFITLDALRIVPGQLPIIAPPPRPVLMSVATPRTLEVPYADSLEHAQPNRAVAAADELPNQGTAPRTTPPRPRLRSVSQAPRPATTPAASGAPARTRLTFPSPEPVTKSAANSAPARSETPSDLERAPIAGSALETERTPPVLTTPPVERARPADTDGTAVVATRRAVHIAAEDDQSRVADVLRRYARAYGQLDVSATLEVWPGVDHRALARAFGSLASQTVSFENCEIDVAGATANASCRGQASYVGKVGQREPRIEPRTWRFELRRDGETWKIQNAEARRTSG